MVGPIVGTGARIAGNVAMKVITSEGAILGKAWWGFKARREIVAGIRTGLGLGAGIGSFINDGSNPYNDGETGTGPSAYKFKKGNRRFRQSRVSRSNKYCRCPSKRSKRLRGNGRYSRSRFSY